MVVRNMTHFTDGASKVTPSLGSAVLATQLKGPCPCTVPDRRRGRVSCFLAEGGSGRKHFQAFFGHLTNKVCKFLYANHMQITTHFLILRPAPPCSKIIILDLSLGIGLEEECKFFPSIALSSFLPVIALLPSQCLLASSQS